MVMGVVDDDSAVLEARGCSLFRFRLPCPETETGTVRGESKSLCTEDGVELLLLLLPARDLLVLRLRRCVLPVSPPSVSLTFVVVVVVVAGGSMGSLLPAIHGRFLCLHPCA